MADEVTGERPAPRGRSRWQIPAEALPPRPLELAVAILVGGAMHAVVDVVDIVATLPLRGALTLRAQHVFFASLSSLGVAAAMAAPLVALSSGRRRDRSWQLLAAYAFACTVAMHAALGVQLRRQATAVLDGRFEGVLYPVYVVLCGLAVPSAHLLGAVAGRMGRLVSLTLGLSLGGMVAGHVLFRDDYPGVHLAILWVAAILGGASVAPLVEGSCPPARRVAWAGVVAIAAWSWSPPNAVRLALFQEPGAVAAWTLARLAWPPAMAEASSDASPPVVRAHPRDVLERARMGLPPDPVVVLITVDALRADLVASGRFDRVLPRLARLRDRGVFFVRATAPGSQTSVTLTSVFSGRYFSQLRWDYYGEGRTRFHYAAEDPAVRFPSILTDAGVVTKSFLGLTFLAGRFGIARGFSAETVVVEGRRHGTATEIMPKLREAIESHGAGPAFFYAHLMEPHEPYDRGAVKTGPPFERYVSEVAVVDRWLGVVEHLLRRHHRGRGYLIVTSDHGEAFGEHGTYFHTKTLYEELIAVPLIVHGPGLLPRRIEARVSLVDLGPTVLHLFGAASPEGTMGISLLPLARGTPSPATRPILAEGRLRRAMLRGDLKVIEDTVRQTAEAYDLREDPDELRNLLDEGHPEATRLLGAMRAFFAAHRIPGYDPPYKP
ncbi:MAG TPA: hypothetical protein ENK57_08345 [Polyangiaceae bacterium]|nr:hypothetical protein [Polyangiaceae bacterium]